MKKLISISHHSIHNRKLLASHLFSSDHFKQAFCIYVFSSGVVEPSGSALMGSRFWTLNFKMKCKIVLNICMDWIIRTLVSRDDVWLTLGLPIKKTFISTDTPILWQNSLAEGEKRRDPHIMTKRRVLYGHLAQAQRRSLLEEGCSQGFECYNN